ncbi:MAG: putative dehydrogenase [Planctomycetota bacterium]
MKSKQPVNSDKAGNSDKAVPAPAVGILGAGRTRQGLGPFLARWFQKSGARITGIAGRDYTRTRNAAVAMSRQLGHDVSAYDNSVELAKTVDALVVACPVEGHLAGLDAALAAGVACLCEKPFVPAADAALGLQRVEAFREAGLLLAENCQWPYALSALDALHPGLRKQPVRSLTMRLSPAHPGRVMVEDSLSHVLSMLQALVPLPADAVLSSVVQSNTAPDATENVVRFEVAGGIGNVVVELHLQCCPQQPRPAWFAVNGVRIDRQLGENYAISFASEDGRTVNCQDPLDLLVYDFLTNLRANPSERNNALDAIALRIRFYAGVLAQL